jgi:hypothetical protein
MPKALRDCKIASQPATRASSRGTSRGNSVFEKSENSHSRALVEELNQL